MHVLTPHNKGVQLTAYSVRCAPAFGSSRRPALGPQAALGTELVVAGYDEDRCSYASSQARCLLEPVAFAEPSAHCHLSMFLRGPRSMTAPFLLSAAA